MCAAPASKQAADRRSLQAGNCLPLSACEPGFWECAVDGAWAPYQWPRSAIIEQAFCRGHADVDLPTQDGMSYCIDFKQPLDAEVHGAVQENVLSGKQRRVRRWPSLLHKQREGERRKAAWGAWLQADWAWLLLDEADAKSVARWAASRSLAPAREAYSLGGGCSFGEAWWPELLRSWPLHGLACVTHPLAHASRPCGFAAQRLLPGGGSGEGAAREWSALAQLWATAGLAHKAQLVGAYRVQNRGLLHGFAAMRQAMLARLSGEGFEDGAGREAHLQARLLWHGTSSAGSLVDICNDGFDRARAQTCSYGKGCYFAASAGYSDHYACAVRVPGEPRPLRALLLAAVLVGEAVQGTADMYPPPVKPHSRMGDRYENACDNVASPKIVVAFKDHQAVPVYVLLYSPAS